MKNFILGCLFIILTSATVIKTELLTIKPATPKSVVTYYGQEPKLFTDKWSSKGYVFKHSHGIHSYSYIVMEKY